MRYQIIFTDLDGTFLNSRGEISGANKKAVADAMAAGKQVVLCSGRSWRSIAYYEQELGLDKPGCYGVSFNGGIVYANPPGDRKFLLTQPLDNTFGQELTRILKEMNAEILIYAGEELFAEEESREMIQYSAHTRIPARVIGDFAKITDDFIKILIKGENTFLLEVEREMKTRFGGRPGNIFFSDARLLEIGPLHGHKGYGMKFLAEHLHIPMPEVIALGDEANDITMLTAAGLGIAVSNAVPGAKAAADIVLPYSNDEDAFSHAVYDYLLK
jgi:Cof subfamily protein (haloacid dehalogenase superfamily)